MERSQSQDNTGVWAYGIKQPGWYCAKRIWSESYAQNLREPGYQVERSAGNPSSAPVTISEVYGDMDIN